MRIAKKLWPLSAMLLSACVSTGLETSQLVPGHKPSLQSTEAGLWYQMDKFEKRLSVSALVDRDPELNNYLRKVVCKLAPEYCQDINLFVLKNPYFNATMSPNGSMHVWTGLLLRVDNEDQLAVILGHELAHYLKRHGIKKFNNAKATTEFLAFFTIATGGLGFGFVGLAATLGAAGSIQAYSRDLETEADKDGLSLIHKAGYNVQEAAKLWKKIKEEKDASKDEKPSVFWSTHPPTELRIANLNKWSEELGLHSSMAMNSNNSEFDRAIQKRWQQWAEELISLRSFEEALVVIDQLEKRNFNRSALEFYRGEIFRRRSRDGDLKLALVHYSNASLDEPMPEKTYKHIALVEKRLGRKTQAIKNFEIYLDRNPDTIDRELVLSYIQQLRK